MNDVSVVLPVFNGAGTIARAIGSILDQTLRQFELIVVDDGSTDGTAEVVRKLADPRIKLVRRSHSGVASAANTALRMTSSPIIARMDADDFAYPRRLEQQLHLLLEQPFAAVGCQVHIVDKCNQSVASMQRYQSWINQETLMSEQISALRFVEFPLVNPTIMGRRAYFELRFANNDLPEDYDLMLRAAARGMRFGKVREVLLDWTDHSERLTRTDRRYTRAAFNRCRRQHLCNGPLSNVDCVDLWGVGQTGKPWLRWLLAEKIDVRSAYDVNQRKLNERIHGVPVMHPDEMATADGTPLVIAVGAAGARELILPHIQSRGFVPGKNAWFVA